MHSMNSSRPVAFSRAHAAKAGAGVASLGALAAASLLGAGPASAAVDADCAVGNTAADQAQLVNLITVVKPSVVCVQGTVTVTSSIPYDYDFTLHGLPGAVLSGGGTTQILHTTTDITYLTVENLRVTGGNNAGASGGAIDAFTIDVYNSQFDDNEASGGQGGAISAYNAYIEDSLFFDNTADYGGAVFVEQDGYFETYRTTYRTNSATATGGAVYVDVSVSSAYPTYVDSSTFNNNSAAYGGALSSFSPAWVENSTYFENTASVEGGALYLAGGVVVHATFLNNTATSSGQSLHHPTIDTLEVRANIFAGTNPQPHLGGNPTNDLGGNLFTTTTEGQLVAPQASTFFGLTLTSLFGGNTLASNGGPTQTVALPDFSLAIDAVPVGTPSVTVDQRGVSRTALSDAGAYEHENPAKPALAPTGSEPAWWLGGVGILALLGGVGAFVLGRRSRRA